MKKLVFLFACVWASMGCNRDSNSSSSSRSSLGGTMVSGTLMIQSSCGSSSGAVGLAYQGAQSAFAYSNVPSGGSFSLQATSAGTYQLFAIAGSCSVGQMVPVPGNYPICLGNACSNYKVGGSTLAKSTFDLAPTFETSPFCQWNVHGCVGTMYTGTGNVIIADAQTRFTAKKDMPFTLKPEVSSGSSMLLASPALTDDGWNVSLQSNQASVEKITYASLTTSYQVDENQLQTADGFCDARENIVARMSDYLKQSGFSAGAVSSFADRWAKRIPANPQFCAYPQGEAQIAKIVTNRSSVALENRRLWFVLVPVVDAATAKVRPVGTAVAKWTAKPGADSFKVVKSAPKVRAIANDPELLSEEIGIGFLIER